MGKHLYKTGKRKCYICNKIYPSTAKYFVKDSSGAVKKHLFGLKYNCKKCSLLKLNSLPPVREQLIKKRNFTCEKCGLYNSNYHFFDIDHIKRIKKGQAKRQYPKRDLPNLQVLCPNCHRIKTISSGDYFH